MSGPDTPRDAGPEGEQEPVVIRDRRRIDPDTGQVREVPPPDGETPAGGDLNADMDAELDELVSPEAVLSAQLAERTDDLLRLKAEFDNYRRRVDRDRVTWGEAAVGKLLAGLLPALDDADRAEQHGELAGTFRTVVDTVVKVLGGAGLERFGATGEPFDPARYEALTSVPTPDAAGETVLEVYRAGYAHGGRVLRPAQVVVATPA